MKKILLFLIAVLSFAPAFGQGLNSDILPEAGSTLYRNPVEGQALRPLQAGEDREWVYTNVTTSGLDSSSWRAAEDAPFAAEFDRADLVTSAPGMYRRVYSSFDGSKPYIPADFFRNTYVEARGSGLYALGNGTEGMAYVLPEGDTLVFARQAAGYQGQAELLVPFGLEIGESFEAREYVQHIYGQLRRRSGQRDSILVVRRIEKMFEMDGVGRLSTPYMTYDPAMRLKTVVSETDSMYVWDAEGERRFGNAYELARMEPTVYSWFAPGHAWQTFTLVRDERQTRFAAYQIPDTDPILYFREFSARVDENAGVITVPLTLNQPYDQEVSAILRTGNVEPIAQPGIDYVPINDERIVFAPGETVKMLDLAILEDTLIEPDESFYIQMDDPEGNLAIGSIDLFVVKIIDDDKPNISFGARDLIAYEDSGRVLVPIHASFGISDTVAVTIETLTRSAIPGLDFNPVNLSFDVMPDETRLFLPVAILDDPYLEDTNSFTLRIASVSDNARIGFSDTVNIRIVDNDFRPNIRFAAESSEVAEATNLPNNNAHIRVRVSAADNTFPIEVHYFVAPESEATRGEDFEMPADTGMFLIPPGTADYTLMIPIINDVREEGDETLILTIFGVSDNAQLSNRLLSHTLTILDNDLITERAGLENNNGLRVYPNPASGFVTLENTSGEPVQTAELANATGQTVFRAEADAISNGRLDLPQLPAGVYILRATSGSEVFTTKLMLE